MASPSQDAAHSTQELIQHALDLAYSSAETNFVCGAPGGSGLTPTLIAALKGLSDRSQKASTGFTNIVTCLAIKAALPDVDIRYHQVQIQNQTERPAGFNFRGVSEKVVYPWLNSHAFEGAKSGWQTRTFERPKPYMIGYDENIGDIKENFLCVFDEIETNGADAKKALACLIQFQMDLRESKNIKLSIPRTKDIQLIVELLKSHFFHSYTASKGASRLPVLALYAIYAVLIEQLDRYRGMSLKALEEHSAADSQTGALGDIEIVNDISKEIFEAIEVKHDIALSELIIDDVARKIMDKSVDRYYVLTTHAACEPDEKVSAKIANLKAMYNCQVIANGVIPSLKYYLRLLSDPSLVIPRYVELLMTDKAVKHEHREVWNKLAIRS